MKRERKSIINAIAAVLLTLTNGLLGMLVMNMVIATYGSDFNGLNSVATQVVGVVLLMEGGMTVATNFALFKPFFMKDYQKVNGILAATYKNFLKIGTAFFIVSLLVATIYTHFINSSLPRSLIFSILIMSFFPAGVNLFYAAKFRIVLQADQKEYVISFISLATISLGHLLNIFLIFQDVPMVSIRIVTMVFSLVNSFLIGRYVKKKYSFLNFDVLPDFEAIQGSRDVLIQRITGTIYLLFPVIFISLLSEGGTELVSVFTVYSMVFALLRGVMQGLIDAPRLAFGEMLSVNKKESVWPFFRLYQLIVFTALFSILVTVAVLIMPFINIYASGVVEINYERPLMALLMVGIMFFEIIHIPSGHILNMSGKFKISRTIQVIAAVFLTTTMTFGVVLNGVYGILLAVLSTALLLAILEVAYIHLRFFEKKIVSFLKLILPFVTLGIIVGIGQHTILPPLSGYLSFFFAGAILFLTNLLIAIVIGILFNWEDVDIFLKIQCQKK